MEQDFRNQADGFADEVESGNSSHPAANGYSLIHFCAWCKEVHVRTNNMRVNDVLTVYVFDSQRKALLNGCEIIVGDGICEPCRAKEFPETKSRASSAQEKGNQR